MIEMQRLADLDDAALRAAYAAPRRPWLRLNFVSTVDGSVTGPDGLSKSLNNDADGRVFAMLRDLADVVVVGAGTIRDEAYRPNPKPLVAVSRSGEVPPSLREGSLEHVYVATGASARGLAEARELLGDRVLVLGDDEPSLVDLRAALVERGFEEILCEGGPGLAGTMLAAGVVDELCATVVPRLVAGDAGRIISGPTVDVDLALTGLIEDDGTLLQRWVVAG